MALSIFLIGGVLLLILIFFIMEHHSRKFKVLVFIVIGLLLYFSVVGVLNSGEADFSSPKGILKTAGFYFSWMGNTILGLWDVGVEAAGKVGNAIKVDKDDDDERRDRK